MNITDLIPVPIKGRTVYVGGDSIPLVPLRPFCDHLGIAWQAQHARIRADATLAPCVTIIVTHDASGRQQEMVALPLNALFVWLVKINPGKVAPAARSLLVAFQMEAGMLIFQAWLGWRHGTSMPLEKGAKPDGALLREIDGIPKSLDNPTFIHANVVWRKQAQVNAEAQLAFIGLPPWFPDRNAGRLPGEESSPKNETVDARPENAPRVLVLLLGPEKPGAVTTVGASPATRASPCSGWRRRMSEGGSDAAQRPARTDLRPSFQHPEHQAVLQTVGA